MIRKVLVSPNLKKDPDFSTTKKTVSILLGCHITVYAESAYRGLLGEGVTYFEKGKLPEDAELIIVLGGDGSVLRAAGTAVELGIPVLGVNLGRLGFLNDLEKDSLYQLERLATGEYSEKTRMMLDVTVTQGEKSTLLPFPLLNDVVISANGHLADMVLEQKGMCSIHYRADGMVISTPSGSTAYTLSAGGPVIDDRMDAICVTPICPRSFFGRSVLFCPEDVLRIENVNSADMVLSVVADGVECGKIGRGDSIVVCRSEKKLRMIVFEPHPTLHVLQQKMNTQNF